MSQYSESLESNEKARYIAKMQAVGLTLEVDPYSKQSGRNFDTNMTIGLRWNAVLFLATLSLTQVYILSKSSCPGNSYTVITISKATMLALCIRGLGMEEVCYAS